ncbi:MAG: ABC transporter ATP-binding protein [Elusimicrobia bacterium]|nr:ABC transporter ATP-binding protein [Elusimicrobiota bacterium]
MFDGSEIFRRLKELQKRIVAQEDQSLQVVAIHDLTLSFHEGEFSAIAGPSGSGKSTLLHLIGTLDFPSQGNIFFKGQDFSQLSENDLADFRLRNLGFIFQAFNLIPVLTALENVEYVLTLQKLPREERISRSREALDLVGLKAESDRFPSQLSGGQQQRVAIARAIVHHPTIVLADEPTANLDSKTSESLMDLMQSLNEKQGMTFLFSSHDPLVLSRARRVIQIRDGHLV